VRLVREKASGHVFAMKKLKKSEMVRRGQARAQPRAAARTTRLPPVRCTALTHL
jgi:hypothetical protein